MSRHHMLPPLLYVAQPRPKKIENRRRRINVGADRDTGETAEAQEATAASPLASAPTRPTPPNFPAIEGAEQKAQNPGRRLSESTLTVMLQAQELT